MTIRIADCVPLQLPGNIAVEMQLRVFHIVIQMEQVTLGANLGQRVGQCFFCVLRQLIGDVGVEDAERRIRGNGMEAFLQQLDAIPLYEIDRMILQTGGCLVKQLASFRVLRPDKRFHPQIIIPLGQIAYMQIETDAGNDRRAFRKQERQAAPFHFRMDRQARV